ncbi:MAG: class I SAM-dependent methyltransferase [Lachnospiraceae bacterium]|nr:class I SAM-dependent methyltransferase [Lachnospiraceae bacterium]
MLTYGQGDEEKAGENQAKREEIGKVRLDYSRYSGEDLYSDGQVEDELLDIVKHHPSSEFADIIAERASWPVLYHLSPLRENILEWVPFPAGKTAKVLEVGSGCGAVTGALSAKAASVTCVDLSRKRSLINAYRHRECGNILIHVGNFKDIEPCLEDDFDFICLTGVFEYGRDYIGGDRPYEDFLRLLLSHLAEGGRILIAIENKYGLKYFAGCKEDHLGTYFSGIENYREPKGARTFGRNGLERIFRSCGVEEYHFYYPYPDYKFMKMLYSDEYLPGKGELSYNMRNFDRDRLLLFDEKSAFDGLTEEELFPLFSNSYLAVIGRDFDVKYVKYSNDRAPEYAIRTEIVMEGGEAYVRKCALSEAAREHVRGMEVSCDRLRERYRGGRLEINACSPEDREGMSVRFEFIGGVPLSQLMDGCLERGDTEGFYRYFREYVDRIGYNCEYPAADFDPIFSNILVEGDRWTLIDYEWTFGKSIQTRELAFRAVYCYLLEDARRSSLGMDRVLRELSVTQEEAEAYRSAETQFQSFVTGNRLSMAQLRDKIGRRMMRPQDWIDRYEDSSAVNRVQVYEDRGGGFSEAESFFAEDAYQGENLIDLELRFGGEVRRIRVDPAFGPCAVKLREATLNGEAVPLSRRKVLSANGRVAFPAGKEERNRPSIVFGTADPGMCISLERLGRREENILHLRMDIVRLPLSMAEDLAGGR